MPYPTVKELRDHQAQVRRSYELGEEVHTRFSASSTIGLNEIGRIVKLINSARKAKSKVPEKDNLPSKQDEAFAEEEPADADEAKVPDSTTVLDASLAVEDKTEANAKRDILYALDTIADLHERIRKYVDKGLFSPRVTHFGKASSYGEILPHPVCTLL